MFVQLLHSNALCSCHMGETSVILDEDTTHKLPSDYMQGLKWDLFSGRSLIGMLLFSTQWRQTPNYDGSILVCLCYFPCFKYQIISV